MIPGQTARLQYRYQDYQNYWETYVKRNDVNDAWDLYVEKVTAGVPSLEYYEAGIGIPTAVRVICDGNTHYIYTVEDGLYTLRETLSDSFLASETHSKTVYSSVIIPTRHRAWARESSDYSTLDRE